HFTVSLSKLTLSNKVQDIKSLGLCLSVSKRFFSLSPMVEDILIKVDCSGELRKLSVVWTINSLIAASARHFVLRQIISEHPDL
ncbi:F-box protein At1g30200-like, partial [Amborella trichopoda]|uniref:F-box protein At1g30200-like n=1 Tax=Amborella trichopoda TaxID=13333 RepID=UPI0009C0DAAA